MQPFTKQARNNDVKPNFTQADYALINAFLNTLNWEEIYGNCTTAEDHWKAFQNILDTIILNFVPFTSSQPNKNVPWFSDSLRRLRLIKQRRWQKYDRNQNIVSYARYQESAKKFKSEFLLSKCNYEKRLFNEKCVDSKKFHNYVRRQNTVCSSIPCLRTADGVLSTSDFEKANALSNQYASVFVNDNGIFPEFNVNCNSSLDNFSCDIQSMIKIIKQLKNNSAPGPDSLTPFFLKNIVASIANPLCKLYNCFLAEGFIPNEWKVAYIIPIYKKGDPQNPANYRPVSLTSVLCKILERIVRQQMLSYLIENDLIPKCQHGFLSKKSTVTNLLECLDNWTANFDRGHQTEVIYLDYSKCFDTVSHPKLLYKLSKMGFGGQAYNWIESFLTD